VRGCSDFICEKDGQNNDILSRASELIFKGERPKG
jgi:hypothetical protein